MTDIFGWFILALVALLSVVSALMADQAQKKNQKLSNDIQRLARDVDWCQREMEKQARIFVDLDTKRSNDNDKNKADIDKIRGELIDLIRVNRDICRRYVLYRDPKSEEESDAADNKEKTV